MTRLWILSDLHLKALPYPENFRPDPPAFDVLVAAGDFWQGDPERAFAALRRLAGDLDPATPTGESIDVARDETGGHHSLTVGDAAALYRRARAALGKRITDDGGALPLDVVTHYAPHPDCIHPSRRGTWNAGNSASDLSALTDCGRVSLWLHGHVHHSLDLTRPGGTRILCNPAGTGFANPAFDEGYVVAIGEPGVTGTRAVTGSYG